MALTKALRFPKVFLGGLGSYDPTDCHGRSSTSNYLPFVNPTFTLSSMELQILKGLGPQFKTNYVRLIASGCVEATALATLQVDWLDFFEVCAKDPEFRSDIEEARKLRADRWIDSVAMSLSKKYMVEIERDNGEIEKHERPPNKDEIARDKLEFEKLKFLAQADNPEKYSAGAKPKINIEFDMSDFKLLSTQEASKVLANDPFAKAVVEAEVVEKPTIP